MECQLQALQRCLHSEYHLEQCLRTLPRTLDETYERMLLAIDQTYAAEARRILQLLCFSSRPMTVPELIDGLAVVSGQSGGLDQRRRLQSPNDLLHICPGLLRIDGALNYISSLAETHRQSDDISSSTVRLAHFSVGEYLKSDRIKHQSVAKFSMDPATCHADIAQICTLYLCDQSLVNGRLSREKLKDFPLAHYAATFWFHHHEAAKKSAHEVDHALMQMFAHRDTLCTWVTLHDPHRPDTSLADLNRPVSDIASAIYFASFLGLEGVLLELLERLSRHRPRSGPEDDINASGGSLGSPLIAASSQGYEKVTRILLERGARTDVTNRSGKTAVHMAAQNSHPAVLKALLEYQAPVNARDNHNFSAIMLAAESGNASCFTILLEISHIDLASDGLLTIGELIFFFNRTLLPVYFDHCIKNQLFEIPGIKTSDDSASRPFCLHKESPRVLAMLQKYYSTDKIEDPWRAEGGDMWSGTSEACRNYQLYYLALETRMTSRNMEQPFIFWNPLEAMISKDSAG